LDRIAEFSLIGTEDISGVVSYSINDSKLVEIIKTENNKCVIKANNKNVLGNFILTATYDGVDYTKDVSIIPLW